MSIEAMKKALEALEEYQAKGAPFMSCDSAVVALRQAIEQAEKREWVGLTDDDIWEVYKKHDAMQYNAFARAIEQKIKEKNGATAPVSEQRG
jgi:hypothetical protein